MPDPTTVGQMLGLVKLAQYTASGIGADPVRALFPTWVAKREAKAKEVEAKGSARVVEIDAAAQSRAVKTLAEGYAEAQTTLEPSGMRVSADVDFSDRVEQSVRFQAAKKQANMESVVARSAEVLGDREVPDEEPDHDWTARFFEYAQDVSSEDMQTLWAKVLAGQVERPGSTSVHTLSALRDLNRDTAQLFARLCSLSMFYIVNETEILDGRVVSLGGNASSNALQDYGLHYGALTRLEEHGLVTSDYNSWRDYGPFPSALNTVSQLSRGTSVQHLMQALASTQAIEYAGDTWYLQGIEGASPSGVIKINGVAMTHAGRELSRVVTITPDTKYTAALSSFLRGKKLELRRLPDMAPLGKDE